MSYHFNGMAGGLNSRDEGARVSRLSTCPQNLSVSKLVATDSRLMARRIIVPEKLTMSSRVCREWCDQQRSKLIVDQGKKGRKIEYIPLCKS